MKRRRTTPASHRILPRISPHQLGHIRNHWYRSLWLNNGNSRNPCHSTFDSRSAANKIYNDTSSRRLAVSRRTTVFHAKSLNSKRQTVYHGQWLSGWHAYDYRTDTHTERMGLSPLVKGSSNRMKGREARSFEKRVCCEIPGFIQVSTGKNSISSRYLALEWSGRLIDSWPIIQKFFETVSHGTRKTRADGAMMIDCFCMANVFLI